MVAGAALTASLITLAVFAPSAAADTGWSRSPGSSLAGGQLRVASSPTTLCQWLAPSEVPPSSSTTAVPNDGAANTPLAAAAAGDPIPYDGTVVELRLERSGANITLGDVGVTPGGAWSGTVVIPDASVTLPGDYQLIAHCVVDDPRLDGVRSFDFDPMSFTVVEGPPPTTVTLPTEIGEPVTVTRPAEVQGTQLTRAAATANTAAAVPTLPNTGDGTLAVALAGIGALLLGAGALWYGGRQTLRHPAKP